ncbi:hypothetical protein OEZ85_011652 [Tetradesmus obliquus]|uniref:Cyclic nucleotide-binding domain-containing protein n=1 Tax=Tetradesmus obliquus TaxID=3088 RepID=A0ABY8TR06_TETOB|nr:hypothetical protein OEZ85_011652 [Tetradesmus obliquus]
MGIQERAEQQQRLFHTLSTRIDVCEAQHGSLPSPDDGQDARQQQQQQLDKDISDDAFFRDSEIPHPRALLVDTLWPLTHETETASCDLAPHAAPKAKELYGILLQGLPRPPWYMISPDGSFRMLWDFLLAVFSIALLLYVPALIAFYSAATECVFAAGHQPISERDPLAPPQPPRSVRFMTVTNMAFLLDIIFNFLTGVRRLNHDTGMIEYCYSMRAVAWAYCRSWLLLDVLSALPVECMVVLGMGGHNYNLGHLNRLLKVFGLRRRAHGDPFRIINRLPCVRRNFNYSMRLVLLASSLLLVGLHYFACALWLALRVQGFPEGTWPVALHLVEVDAGQAVNVYQAWTWSVFAVTSAMIGLGYGSFPPLTFPEAVLWILEMIFMAGGFATVNGFIFSAILESLATRARYKANMVQVQHEVERRQLPQALGLRVVRFFQLTHRDKSMQDSGEFMGQLAPGLRLQVALSTVGGLLSKLAVLRDTPQLLQRTALLVEHQVAPEGQLITIPGTPHRLLYFLARGYADLYMGDTLIDTLVAGDTFGEAALLPVPPPGQLPPRLGRLWRSTNSFSARFWPTLFSVRALSNCSLVVLDADKFSELLEEYDWAQQRLQEIGRHYAGTLDALPLLETLWKAAATFDPLKSPSALMLASSDARAVKAAQRFSGRQALLRKRGLLDRPGWWKQKGDAAGGDAEGKSGGKAGGRSGSNLARP